MKNKQIVMEFLRRHRENRAAMVSLRYLLKSTHKWRGWQIIAKINGIGDCAIETIAGLYAFHPVEKVDKEYNFGDACRALSAARKKIENTQSEDKSPFDRRFRRLLVCDTREELCIHLFDVVRGLKAKAIPINYETLYEDIKFWSESVREKWAIHYWSEGKETEDVSDGN